jgi:hypothetical protein
MIEGVDYSFNHPSPTGLYEVGKRFAGRYLGPGMPPKDLTRVEADGLKAAGLTIVALVEATSQGAMGGRAAGQAHAHSALAEAPGVGMPDGHPFYFAVDFDVSPAQWPTVREYLAGAADVLGLDRVGVYGGYNAMVWAARDHAARWLFQTYAWSWGRWYVGRNIEQYRNGVSLVGGTVDLCRGLTPYFGQWTPGGDPVTTPDDTATKVTRIDWSVGLGAPKQPGVDPPGNERITYWAGHVTDRLAALQASVDALATHLGGGPSMDTAALTEAVTLIQGAVDAITSAPLIDAVAVAAAIAADRSLVDAIASGVAASLAKIQGEITMTGTLSGGIVAPPA